MMAMIPSTPCMAPCGQCNVERGITVLVEKGFYDHARVLPYFICVT
jgi:hypothetical protein